MTRTSWSPRTPKKWLWLLLCFGARAAWSASPPIPPVEDFANFGPGDGPAFEFSALVEAGDDNFYGVSAFGGAGGYGYVYGVSRTTGQITHLHDFGYQDGATPRGTLAVGPDGALYGTTEAGGANQGGWCPQLYQKGACGVAYKVTLNGQFTKLHDFNSTDDGNQAGAQTGLIAGTDGNLYGNAYSWQLGASTIFRMTPAGQVSMFVALTESAASEAQGGLVQGKDGSLYGTLVGGGRYGYGYIFRVTLAGHLRKLHDFAGAPVGGSGDGLGPTGPLVQGTDGAFYGTTHGGGLMTGNCVVGGCGTIYRVTRFGMYSVLYRFTGGASDGMWPQYAGLVQAPDGLLYGATNGNPQGYIDTPLCRGDASTGGCGTLYRISTKGMLELVFNIGAGGGADGYWPDNTMLLASDGNLYGITESAGPGGEGVVYGMLLMPATAPHPDLAPRNRIP